MDNRARFSRRRAFAGAGAWLALAALAATSTVAAGESRSGKSSPDTLRAQALRAFGSVTTAFEEAADRKVSVLRLAAADVTRAALLHAKYLDDLTRTTGANQVKTRALDPDGPRVHDLPGGGLILAALDGNEVLIVYAADEARLRAELARLARRFEAANTQATVGVPEYLGVWSQHAFRFYYSRAGDVPEGEDPATYDFDTEFQWAKKLGGFGVVFWAENSYADFAAGLTNENNWSWAQRLAKRHNLPVVLNPSLLTVFSIGNAYRDQMALRVPQYAGGFRTISEQFFGGIPFHSWGARDSRAAELSALQDLIRRRNGPEVISILEPHMEISHDDSEMFMEYGPVADASFREYLQETYGDLETVAARYQLEPGALADWSQLRLPEIAELVGWTPDAIDLAGAWRIGYLDELPGGDRWDYAHVESRHRYNVVATPEAWMADTSPEFDADWPLIENMPGSDESMFLPKRPAVLRRHFTLDEVPEGRVWLHLWDLNGAADDYVDLRLNGEAVGREPVMHQPHWGAYEVTGALRAGENLLAVRVPKGVIAYRVYLSTTEPTRYPNLPGAGNARWVDLSRWRSWTRARAVDMGLKAIRAVEPDKDIVVMSMERFMNDIRDVVVKHGGHFHETGGMANFHYEFGPMIMRGVDRAMGCEPGGRAESVKEFKRFAGNWIGAGPGAIQYFHHLTDIVARPEIRDEFARIAPAFRQLGRSRGDVADIAEVYDSDVRELVRTPWNADANIFFPSGFQPDWWWFSQLFLHEFASDAILVKDFATGRADRYPIAIDMNTTILTDEAVAGIRAWVERGGIFLAMTQTGRHTPEAPETWPIQKLTGYRGDVFTRYRIDSWPESTRRLALEPGQPVFPPAAFADCAEGAGAALLPVADDVETLWRWDDGRVAVGMRRVGAGTVITFGAHLPVRDGKWGEMIRAVMRWARARPLPLDVDRNLVPRHALSINGLFDVWTLKNPHDREQDYEFRFRDGQPRDLTDILTDTPAPARGTLGVYEFAMTYSPRPDPERASVRWFNFLAGDWSGVERPATDAVIEAPDNHLRLTLPLSGDWDFRALGENESAAALLAAAPADGWTPRAFGPWLKDFEVSGGHYLVKRTFTIPDHWKNGKVLLWFMGNFKDETVYGEMEIFLNGESLTGPGYRGGLAHRPLALKAGDSATLAIDLRNRHPRLHGFRGNIFLSFLPEPDQVVDLLDQPFRVRDSVTAVESRMVRFPDEFTGALADREFDCPEIPPEGRVFIYMDTDSALTGVFINGRYVRRFHHRLGDITWLDVTPWIRGGEVNRFAVVDWERGGEGHRVRAIEMQIFNRSPYE